MGCPVFATMCPVGTYVSIQQHNFMQPQTHKPKQREGRLLVPLRTGCNTFHKNGKVFGLSFISIIVLIFYAWSFTSMFSIHHQNTLRMHSGSFVCTTKQHRSFAPGSVSFIASVTIQGNQNWKEEITKNHNINEYYGLLGFYAVCFTRQTRRSGWIYCLHLYDRIWSDTGLKITHCKDVGESGIRTQNDTVEPVILFGVVGERKGWNNKPGKKGRWRWRWMKHRR